MQEKNRHEITFKKNQEKLLKEYAWDGYNSSKIKHRKRLWYTLGLGIYGGLIFGISFISGIVWGEWRITKKINEYDEKSSYKENENAINKQQGENYEK